MLNGLSNNPRSVGRIKGIYSVSNGGVLFFNPFVFRAVPAYFLLNTGTITLSSFKEPPGTYMMFLAQDSGGSKGTSFTWPSWWRWVAGAPPTLTATANKIDIVTLASDGQFTTAVFSLAA